VCLLLYELCSLLALASCAREYNYNRPQLTNSSVVIITAGRFVVCTLIVIKYCYYYYYYYYYHYHYHYHYFGLSLTGLFLRRLLSLSWVL